MKSTKRKFYFFGMLLIIIVALALIMQYTHFNSLLKESKKINIVEYNEGLKDKINSKLEYNKQYVNSIAKFIGNVNWTDVDAKKYFKSLTKENDVIRSIYFGDTLGNLINSDNWNPPEDFKLKKRNWYIDAIEKDGIIVSSVYTDALDKNQIVTISKAVYDEQNNILGVVAADIRVEDITKVVKDLTNNLVNCIFLIDGDGNVLAYDQREFSQCDTLKSLKTLGKEKYEEIKITPSGKTEVELGNISGYLFYDSIGNTDWIVASFISLEGYLKNEEGIWSMFFIALGLSMIILGLFTYLFRKYFINPTIQFYNDAKKINPIDNKGYRMPKYKEDHFDEIRDLTNGMVEKVEYLMIEQEKITEEVVAQNEELEASYNQLSAMEQELRYQNKKLTKSERNLEEALEKNRAVNEALPDTLFIINSEGKFLDIQTSNKRELYITREEFVGKYIEDIFSDGILARVKDKIENVLKNNIVEKFEYELNMSIGVQRYEIRIAKMNEGLILAIARNITKRKELEDQLTNLSYKDQLTNLYNRRYFEERLKQIDVSNNLPISIIMADVNGLKLINDSFGHKIGDELIKGIGNIISQGCRADDIVFRISGDEFVIVLLNTDKKVAEKVIDRIKNISKHTNLKNEELKDLELAVSFGIGTKESINKDIYEVVKEAEDNMYYHKLHEGQKMRLKTIKSMIDSLHKKNPRLKKSSMQILKYAEKLAIALNLSDDMKETIQKVGFYKEIGKITISGEVLSKTEGFTEKELEEINKHPEIGYRILSTVNEMIEVAKYVLYHHERYDGLGYPKGLKGEQIPYISRILSVVDYYVQILMKEKNKEKTIEKFKEKAGFELDPKLVNIFIEEVLKYEGNID